MSTTNQNTTQLLRKEVNYSLEQMELVDIACDLHGASETFTDIGVMMHALIHDDLSEYQIKALARMVQHTAESWASITDIRQKKIETKAGRKVTDTAPA